MTPQNQVEPDPQTPADPCETSSLSRAVLYANDPRGGLLRCGRDAQRRGDRIVSATSEGEDRRSGRQALYALIERMLQGEFDTIVAAVASDAPAQRSPRLVRLSCVAVDQ